MPELPEVETVARDLRSAVLGRRIESVRFGPHNVVRTPPAEVRSQRSRL